jgi:sec-independent protein translocase protein TatA
MLDFCFQIAFIGPGGPELLVVMLVLLLMFGAKDAPKIFRKINEMLNSVRNTADGFKREIMYGDLNTPTNSSSSPTEESDHDDDYNYDDDYGAEDYNDDDEDNGEEEFKEMVEELKAEESLDPEPDSDVQEDEDGDAPKT